MAQDGYHACLKRGKLLCLNLTLFSWISYNKR